MYTLVLYMPVLCTDQGTVSIGVFFPWRHGSWIDLSCSPSPLPLLPGEVLGLHIALQHVGLAL